MLLLFSRSVVSGPLWPHGLQHARLPCPSLSPRACSNSCPLSRWCHPTSSSSVTCFSSYPQSFPASGSFPVSQFFASGGQSIGASTSPSVLPLNIQGWFPLGLTGLISLLCSSYELIWNLSNSLALIKENLMTPAVTTPCTGQSKEIRAQTRASQTSKDSRQRELLKADREKDILLVGDSYLNDGKSLIRNYGG